MKIRKEERSEHVHFKIMWWSVGKYMDKHVVINHEERVKNEHLEGFPEVLTEHTSQRNSTVQ